MALREKRLKKVWKNMQWVEVVHPTTVDLVEVSTNYMLDEKLDDMTADLTTHETDTSLHATSGEKAKLANLATDADATYATKTELSDHTTDTGTAKHVSSTDKAKLANLAADADATYATKEELAGKTKTWVYDDIADRDTDLAGFTTDEIGTMCIVKDPSDDEVNEGVGPAQYILVDDGNDGVEWQYLFHLGGAEISTEWDEIAGKPSSSATDIDDAVAKKHTHTNKSVLDKFTEVSGDILYDGSQIGVRYNQVFFQDTEPLDVINGDVWLAPIEEEEP